MRRMAQASLGVIGVMMVAGCRTATRVTDVPRVDLELSGGNRGYLVGTPPEAGNLKTTRQMVETDVEVPSWYKPTHVRKPVGIEELGPSQAQIDAIVGAPSGTAKMFDVYVVQKGDSLWTIAAKPEIYGKATRWRRIFDANRDILKSPERVRAGMTLKIPRGDEGAGSTTYGDEGVSYKK